MSAPYYPQIELTQVVTRFGAIETSNPNLYRTPIKGKRIYELDTLVVLKEIWGDNILQSRRNTYKIVSGKCSDIEYRQLLQSYYRKYAAFTNYVNNAFLFGDRTVPEIRRLVLPARDLVDNYASMLMEEIANRSMKFLMRTHDYIYCAVPYESKHTMSIDGTVVVC